MQSNSLRENIEQLFLKSVRFYTFNTPIPKGKYRLYQLALKICRYPPKNITTKTHDGREYLVDLTNEMNKTVYFLGEYEPSVTQILSSIIKYGDVCLDIGANFGWFTFLLHRLCNNKNQSRNETGEVHAFEPMPPVFASLQKNWKIAGEPKNVFLNNLALGNETKEVNLYRFTNLPDGYSSLSNEMDKKNSKSFPVQMTSLNSYLKERKINEVNFVKLDIEGAELMFLEGATNLFLQKTPPIFMVEMALGTTENFGYLPNDLIEFIRQHADYNFYALNDTDFSLHKMDGFAPEDIGAHVLCVPANCESSRLEKLNIVE